MTKHVMLNNITHKDLKIITAKSAQFGDDIGSTLTFPTEYGDVQREYPIFFRKEPTTGEFQSIALFGFSQRENLFLDEKGWHASYIPIVVDRGPFLIGFQTEREGGEEWKSPVIHIDLDNPRVSQTEGEPLFLEHGGNSPYLERMSRMLRAIHDGNAISKAMFAAFTELDLIEPITLSIELNDGSQNRLQGYYTINQERLANLSGEELFKLNKSGFLQAAFLAVSSLHNVKKLIEIKNSRL